MVTPFESNVSKRSEPLHAHDGKPSAGARIKGAQRPEILVLIKFPLIFKAFQALTPLFFYIS